jgi:hypothetical protein
VFGQPVSNNLKPHQGLTMQTSQVAEFKGVFSEMTDPVRTGEAIGMACGHIFNNGALIQDKSCVPASR